MSAPSSPRYWVALAVILSACGGNPNELNDSHEFSITFCASRPQVFAVAQQDGDGDWQRVSPASEPQSYRFAFDHGRGAIAIKSTVLSIYFATPVQLEQFLRVEEASCGSKSATGSVIGLADADSADVQLAQSAWVSNEPGDPRPFALERIWSGPRNLVAMARGADVRYILRTGSTFPMAPSSPRSTSPRRR